MKRRRVIKESGKAKKFPGVKVDSKDSHMLIKPPFEVLQIINDVNVNKRHIHSDDITILSLHFKCKILLIMALNVITNHDIVFDWFAKC